LKLEFSFAGVSITSKAGELDEYVSEWLSAARASEFHAPAEGSDRQAASGGRVPVSDLCDECQLLPNQFYQWQKQLFEGGSAAFERPSKPAGPSPAERRVLQLEAKLAVKNEVIAELMAENVNLKKQMRCSESQVGGPRHPR
jgi:transposase